MAIKEIKDDDWDFGFSDDLNDALAVTADEAEKQKAKAQQIVDMILPLLNNLKKNPDKPNIVWPEREKKINEFIKRMNDVLKS